MSDTDSTTDSSSDDMKQPQPSNATRLHPISASKHDSDSTPGLKPNRSKVFNPAQAMLWSKKSIALESDAMLRNLQEHLIEYDAAGGNPSDIDFMSDSADLNDNDDNDEPNKLKSNKLK